MSVIPVDVIYVYQWLYQLVLWPYKLQNSLNSSTNGKDLYYSLFTCVSLFTLIVIYANVCKIYSVKLDKYGSLCDELIAHSEESWVCVCV